MDFLEPRTLDEACQLLAEDPWGTKVISGGTALVLMMQQGFLAPETLVSLRRIPNLDGISQQDGVVRIGAGTTLTEVAESPVVRQAAPSLAFACRRVGNIRVRNVATLGGNLAEADYASDPPTVLSSLGAVCTVRGADQTRTVPVSDFVTGFYSNALEDGELLTEIVVPTPASGRRAVYFKYVSRSSEDRPCVGVAARADFDGERVRDLDVVIAAVASTPQRVPDVTEQVRGQTLDATVVDEVSRRYAEGIDPMDDSRGSAWYRRQMIAVFVRRALEAVASPTGAREAMPGV